MPVPSWLLKVSLADEVPRKGATRMWRALRSRGNMSDNTTTHQGRFDWLTLGSAAVSFALTVYLVFQCVFPSVDSQEFPLTAQDIARDWTTAAIMIGIQVALLVRAVRLHRGGLVLISSVALNMAMGVSLLLSLPQIDWRPDPPAYTTNPAYVPCYSGSNDCVGG